MADPAHKVGLPPADIADALEAVGRPRNSTMMDIIMGFLRMKEPALGLSGSPDWSVTLNRHFH